PDLSAIDDEAVQGIFAANRIGDSLEAVFVTDVRRRTWPLRMFDSEIELALDQGEIRSGERSMTLSEVELELKSGRPERLYELAMALHRTVPFVLESRTKADRGY